MTLAIFVGLGIGSGIWILFSGLNPKAPSLEWAIARGRRSDEDPQGIRERLERSPALGDLTSPLEQDLAVLELGRLEAVFEVGGYMLAGLVFPLVAVILTALSIFDIAWTIPLWLALICSAVGATVSVRSIRQRAVRRREEMVATLGAVLDLCALALASGRGLEGAIERSTVQGDQPAMVMLRHSVQDARRYAKPLWEGFESLGAATGVGELRDLAASLRLSGQDGARIREAMVSKARSIRNRQLAEAEAEANRMTEQLQVPLSLLAVGLLVLLLYPAVVAVGGS